MSSDCILGMMFTFRRTSCLNFLQLNVQRLTCLFKNRISYDWKPLFCILRGLNIGWFPALIEAWADPLYSLSRSFALFYWQNFFSDFVGVSLLKVSKYPERWYDAFGEVIKNYCKIHLVRTTPSYGDRKHQINYHFLLNFCCWVIDNGQVTDVAYTIKTITSISLKNWNGLNDIHLNLMTPTRSPQWPTLVELLKSGYSY